MIRTASQLFILMTVVALLAAAPAFAEVRTGAFTLTPMLGYQVFDSDLDLKDSEAYGLAIGYTPSKNWALELGFRYVPSEVDNSDGPDVNAISVTADVLYHFMPEQIFVPYLVGGIGGLQYEIDGGSNDEDFIANWGGGFKYSITNDVALRLDLRHTIDFRTNGRWHDQGGDDIINNFGAMFGLNVQFGGTSLVPAQVNR